MSRILAAAALAFASAFLLACGDDTASPTATPGLPPATGVESTPTPIGDDRDEAIDELEDQIESLRDRLSDLRDDIGDSPLTQELENQADALDDRLQGLNDRLDDLRDASEDEWRNARPQVESAIAEVDNFIRQIRDRLGLN